MTSPSILASRRQLAEQYIEQLIALLDSLDGDPDLEDSNDTEPNGDELDFSGHTEEALTLCGLSLPHFDGSGTVIAESMIRGLPDAARRAAAYLDAGPVPVLYDFRGTRK